MEGEKRGRRGGKRERKKEEGKQEKKDIRSGCGPAANFQRKRKTGRNEIQRFPPLVPGFGTVARDVEFSPFPVSRASIISMFP